MSRKELIQSIGKALDIYIIGNKYIAINELLNRYEQTLRKKRVYISDIKNHISFDELDKYATEICEKYKITLSDLRGKNRCHHFVAARVHFCRKMRIEHRLTLTMMAHYLNRDHSSICNYMSRYKMLYPMPIFENEILINDRKATA